MKIGLLTFHYAHNYGAVLQAYALKKYLENQGYSVNVINYQNTAIASEYTGRLKYKYDLLSIVRSRSIEEMVNKVESNLDILYAQKGWSERKAAFLSFICSKLVEQGQDTVDSSIIGALEYDALIAGSDQIWNSDLTGGYDPVYFLDFSSKAKKVFYGASVGYTPIPPSEDYMMKRILKDATAIGVREKGLEEHIKKQYGINAVTVVDPTLLLQKKDYESMLSDIDAKEEFVLAYFITEDKQAQDVAEYIARCLNVKLVEFHCYSRRDLKGHTQHVGKTPCEFLSYIAKAKMVVTNSFHGTVFSLLFEKDFYSVYRKDSRKDNLLERVALDSRHIYSLEEVNLREEIKYTEVKSKLDELRKDSVQFLNDALR